jgi:hypothetical protein
LEGCSMADGTLLGIDKARRMLGCSPDFTWRELF